VRLAYLVTHPIQYQAPLLRRIAAEPGIELKVFFASDVTLRKFVDVGFQRAIEWDVPLRDGYDYEVLPHVRRNDRVSFWQPVSYGLSSRLKAGRFDALWIHGYMRWHHWVAMITAKRLGLKVLLRDEATEISIMRSKLRRNLKKLFFAGLRQIVDRFLAIGSLNAAYYRQHDVAGARIFLMPYAVDNAFFQGQASASAVRREALRHQLGLASGRPVILYAGKLSGRKGPRDLLEAYLQLSPNGRDEPYPYLLYVGDGEQRSELEASAGTRGWNSIRFLGFKNQHEIPSFYDLCEVFVLPSRFEPWGLAANEAMNAAKAVIVSHRAGCAPDLVRDGVNGFVFRAGDPTDLMRTLRDAFDNRSRCAEMGRRGLEIINRWSFEEDVQGLRAALSI
jgi:glycosyltransferase involved in cell wall biosynthesis